MGTLTGVVALLLALGIVQPFNQSASQLKSAVPVAQTGETPRFDGVAGHLAESRALLDFLDQHDDEPVQLEVGFPDLATGPAGGDNVFVETIPFDGGTRSVPTTITLMTECDPLPPASEENPTVSDGCMGTALTLDGHVNNDSGAGFEHGVPVISGYFLVDVTGNLQMGVTLILLRPLTFEQATGS